MTEDIEIKDKKKTIIGLIIAGLALTIMLIGATLAYFGSNTVVNFNTATITYETDSKSVIILNGTSALLTLGTIDSNDMSRFGTNVTYYASSTDKTTTPTEVKLGEAVVDTDDDEFTYECQFTLSLTHSGTDDIIDRFLSNSYTNKSTGQLILTVNGVEYDIYNGFPSTITGTTTVDLFNPGEINVGFKFINLNNVDQGYLTNTNGVININANSFSCSTDGTSYFDIVYKVPGFYTGEPSTTNIRRTAVEDYHDIYYTYLIDENNAFVANFSLKYINEFNTSSECENAFEGNNTCILAGGKYKIQYNGDYVPDYIDVQLGSEFFVEQPGAYYPKSACEKSLNEIKADYRYLDSNLNHDFDNYSCDSINPEVFIKETIKQTIAVKDEWAIQYYRGYDNVQFVYLNESDCWDDYLSTGKNSSSTTKYYSYNGNPCVLIGENSYSLKSLLLYIDDYGAFYSLDRTYDKDAYDVLTFDSESDCTEYLNNYLSLVNANITEFNHSCILVREEGEEYQDYSSEYCVYDDYYNDIIKCFAVEDETFWNDIDNVIADLEDNGFICSGDYSDEVNGKTCVGDSYTVNIIKNYRNEREFILSTPNDGLYFNTIYGHSGHLS